MSAHAVTIHHTANHNTGHEDDAQETFSSDIRGLPASVPTQTVELSDGDVYDVRVAPVTKRIGDDTVRMLAYNGSVPGPTVRVRQGTELVDVAGRLDPGVIQLHSNQYRNPDALPAGRVLVVGAGNSGGQVAKELSGTHEVELATGYRTDHSWIDVPDAVDDGGRLRQVRGVTPAPGLYTLGLPWQHTRGSALLGWVGADAEFIAALIAATAIHSNRESMVVSRTRTAHIASADL